MNSTSELIRKIATLLEHGALVSFYDAHRLVRYAHRLGEPAPGILLGLVAVHDELSTDGAQEILADYLRAAGSRIAAQYALASRVVLLRDDGKVARSQPRTTLRIELEERRVAGLRWRLDELSGPARVEKEAARDEPAPRARFLLTCLAPGAVKVRFVESQQISRRFSHSTSQAPSYRIRKMALSVVVEEEPQGSKLLLSNLDNLVDP